MPSNEQAAAPKSSQTRGHSCAALVAAKLRWRMLFGAAAFAPLEGIPKLITSPDLLETESSETSTCTRSRVSNNLR